LINHPVLNSAEFFGGLRALASNTGGLVLITASRQAVSVMNRLTQDINRYGSPFFNILAEINLGPLPGRDIRSLLDRAGESFSTTDRRFIQAVAGGHPYLLQVASSAVLDAHEEGHSSAERYREAAKSIHRITKAHFADTWRMWTGPKRKVLTLVALAEILSFLSEQPAFVRELLDSLRGFGPELSELEDVGVIMEGEARQHRVAEKALLWWVADELVRQARDRTTLEQWLRTQGLDALFSRDQREVVSEAVESAVGLMHQGVVTMVEMLVRTCH
jgi:hypothetical protein